MLSREARQGLWKRILFLLVNLGHMHLSCNSQFGEHFLQTGQPAWVLLGFMLCGTAFIKCSLAIPYTVVAICLVQEDDRLASDRAHIFRPRLPHVDKVLEVISNKTTGMQARVLESGFCQSSLFKPCDGISYLHVM